jgi:hypothetical protein
MHVKMLPQLTAPCMKYAVESYQGPKMSWVLPELEQCLSSAVKKKIIKYFPVVQTDGKYLVGKGENHMVVRDRKNICQSGPHPLALGYPLAFWTMSIAAGIIGMFRMVAFAADIDMITQRAGPAILYIKHDRMLFRRQFMSGAVFIAIFPENVGKFQLWTLFSSGGRMFFTALGGIHVSQGTPCSFY